MAGRRRTFRGATNPAIPIPNSGSMICLLLTIRLIMPENSKCFGKTSIRRRHRINCLVRENCNHRGFTYLCQGLLQLILGINRTILGSPAFGTPSTFPNPRRKILQLPQRLICFTQFQPIFRRFDLEGVIDWQVWSLSGRVKGELIFYCPYLDRLHELVCCFHAGDFDRWGWTNTGQPPHKSQNLRYLHTPEKVGGGERAGYRGCACLATTLVKQPLPQASPC